ncbi:MAG: hypothetical protein QM621_00295 [Aeromicrobium sp.]|uniref:hypothetical protein n=1 Tax=Aeromicrobium sp. TaxID=1871063 RepID=UPI0039E6BB05
MDDEAEEALEVSQPGASPTFGPFAYVVTQADVEVGGVVNTGNVTMTDAPVEDTEVTGLDPQNLYLLPGEEITGKIAESLWRWNYCAWSAGHEMTSGSITLATVVTKSTWWRRTALASWRDSR